MRAMPGRNRRPDPVAPRRWPHRASVRLSVPPSRTANKAPIPPAMAGTVAGQPLRKRLRIDDDPFGAVGDYAGGFLVKSAVELGGGYDTNPARTFVPRGSPFFVVAPEFLAVSTGSVTPSSPTCGDRSPATASGFRRQPTARFPRRRPIWTGRISSATSTAASTSATIPVCWARCACASPPTIPAAPTSRRASPDTRFMRRSAAPLASTRASIACRFPPAAASIAPSITIRNSPTALRPAMTTATSINSAASAGSATISCRASSRSPRSRATAACTTSGSIVPAMRAIPAEAMSRPARRSNSRGS